jgi:hypothetical protein
MVVEIEASAPALLIVMDTHIPNLVSECIATGRRNVGRPRRKWRQEHVQYKDGANQELLAHKFLAGRGDNGDNGDEFHEKLWALCCSIL